MQAYTSSDYREVSLSMVPEDEVEEGDAQSGDDKGLFSSDSESGSDDYPSDSEVGVGGKTGKERGADTSDTGGSTWQKVHGEDGDYWWNPSSGATSWDNPGTAAEGDAADSAGTGQWAPTEDDVDKYIEQASRPLPAGWQRVAGDSGTYYWNESTGETSWKCPYHMCPQQGWIH